MLRRQSAVHLRFEDVRCSTFKTQPSFLSLHQGTLCSRSRPWVWCRIPSGPGAASGGVHSDPTETVLRETPRNGMKGFKIRKPTCYPTLLVITARRCPLWVMMSWWSHRGYLGSCLETIKRERKPAWRTGGMESKQQIPHNCPQLCVSTCSTVSMHCPRGWTLKPSEWHQPSSNDRGRL